MIKANKRFDMFVLTGVRHSFAPVAGYVNLLRSNYFARHLLGQSSTSVDIVELSGNRQGTDADQSPVNAKLQTPNFKGERLWSSRFGVWS